MFMTKNTRSTRNMALVMAMATATTSIRPPMLMRVSRS